MILKLTFFLALVKLGYFYPSGAPLEACDSMYPDHGVDPLTDPPPFSVLVNPLSSTLFNVTILTNNTKGSNSKGFKGFLLESRTSWDGIAIGTWKTNVKNTKTLACSNSSNSAVTHHLDDKKKFFARKSIDDDDGHFKSVSFMWTPPRNQKLIDIKFIATVVESYKKIYLNVSTTYKVNGFFQKN